jgi:hypothetical protein
MLSELLDLVASLIADANIVHGQGERYATGARLPSLLLAPASPALRRDNPALVSRRRTGEPRLASAARPGGRAPVHAPCHAPSPDHPTGLIMVENPINLCLVHGASSLGELVQVIIAHGHGAG